MPVHSYLDLPQEIQDKVLGHYYVYDIVVSNSPPCFFPSHRCVQEDDIKICGLPNTSLKLTCHKIRRDIQNLGLHTRGFTGTVVLENKSGNLCGPNFRLLSRDSIFFQKSRWRWLNDRVTTISIGSFDNKALTRHVVAPLTWCTGSQQTLQLPNLKTIELNWHGLYDHHYGWIDCWDDRDSDEEEHNIDICCADDIMHHLKLRALVMKLQAAGRFEVMILVRFKCMLAEGPDAGVHREILFRIDLLGPKLLDKKSD